MKLIEYLGNDHILLNLKSKTKQDVLKELAEYAAGKGFVPDAAPLLRGLTERENLISTGIGGGVAIPHTRYEGPEKVFIALARCLDGMDFDALDGEPVFIFILIAGPEKADKEQLKILSRTARLLKQTEFRDRLLSAESVDEILKCIREEEALF